MPGRTMVYGSGGKDADAIENVLVDQNKKTSGEDAQSLGDIMMKNPLTIPLAPLAYFVSSLQQGAAGLGSTMSPRRFSSWGEVVPTTSTKELNQKNIFG